MAIRLLIVDDSPIIVKSLITKFESESEIEVVGSASSTVRARSAIIELTPDVIVLDLDLPKFDGLSLLRDLMNKMPKPVVVFTADSTAGSKLALEALSLGAFDIVAKPSTNRPLPDVIVELTDKIIAASKIPKKRLGSFKSIIDQNLRLKKANKKRRPSKTVIALAASTGGPRCLENLLGRLPAKIPGIIVVQHITKGFTKNLAKRLSSLSALHVKEAEDGELVEDGKVILAPYGSHITLAKKNQSYMIKLKDTPAVGGHKPSATVLFDSVAKIACQNSIGAVLTGMGDDGAEGLLEMKKAGARTFAQDETSSVVFGMPKAAFSIGACDDVVALEDMPTHLVELVVYSAPVLKSPKLSNTS